MSEQPENPRPYDEPLHPHIGVPYGEWPQYPGATMRDYFAAAALTGGMANADPRNFATAASCAKMAYEIADAMLRERGK